MPLTLNRWPAHLIEVQRAGQCLGQIEQVLHLRCVGRLSYRGTDAITLFEQLLADLCSNIPACAFRSTNAM